ncbi:DsbA family protein [Paracoccus pacificus]|uniref:DsbA family protein n=1 Tax=Paracoccus pacificus TaxID=1463598 RepID=A0ABW4R8C1_9RHOB
MSRIAAMPRVAALVLMTTAIASPALAFDPKAMSDDEKAGFGEAVRSYLLENPEVLLEAMQVYEQRQQAAQSDNDRVLVQTNKDEIFSDGYSWVGGNPEGDLTMVEFIDYRCTYCRKAFNEVNALVKKDGNIRYILKEFPILGEESVLASRFAIAMQQIAGPEVYKKVHDELMTMRGAMTLETMRRIATDLGQDPDAVTKRMNEESVTAVIRKNAQLAERMRIQGTPTFVVGPVMLRGYLPENEMAKAVADARKEAKG